MRNVCLYIFLFLGCLSNAQNRTELAQPNHTRNIKLNPISLAIGSVSIHYEKIISKEKSITLFGNGIDLRYHGNIYGFGLGAGLRSYFSGSDKNSFFVEPFFKYMFLTTAYNNANINSLSIGLVAGRKLIFAQRITFEFFGGPLLSKGFIKEGNLPAYPNADFLGPLNGIWFRGGITVGFQFK